jgi:hypothetical protein
MMKHRLWLALQANQTMSLRDGALTATIEGLRILLERLKAKLAEAKPSREATHEQAPYVPGFDSPPTIAPRQTSILRRWGVAMDEGPMVRGRTIAGQDDRSSAWPKCILPYASMRQS